MGGFSDTLSPYQGSKSMRMLWKPFEFSARCSHNEDIFLRMFGRTRFISKSGRLCTQITLRFLSSHQLDLQHVKVRTSTCLKWGKFTISRLSSPTTSPPGGPLRGHGFAPKFPFYIFTFIFFYVFFRNSNVLLFVSFITKEN